MNCQVTQKKITEGFAAGSAALSQDARMHQENCAKYRLFYEQEMNLFASLDAGLQNLVNQPVPTSLLPRLRAALEQTPVRRPLTLPAWSLAALTVAMVAVLSLGLLLNHVHHRASKFESQAVVSQSERPPEPKTPLPLRVASNATRRTKPAITPLTKKSGSRPEVTVLAEEREAFAQFLADHAKEPLALVAAPKALDKSESAIDIALLTIKKVNIEPLQGTVEE